MSYFPSTIKCWNNLPVNVLSSESVPVFKNRLLEWYSRNRRGEHVIKSYLLLFCAGYYGKLLNQIRYNLSSQSHAVPLVHVQHCWTSSSPRLSWLRSHLKAFFACIYYSISRVEMNLKLQNIFQTFELNYDILDEDRLLFIILHWIDPASHDLTMEINEQIIVLLAGDPSLR